MTAMRDMRLDRIGYDHQDPSLKAGPEGLTVWDLRKMAQEKKYGELDDLFDISTKESGDERDERH